jgi:hypothetical protein
VRIPNFILYQQLIEDVDKKFQKSLYQKHIFDLRSQRGIQTKNLPRHIKSDKINICKWSREATDFITNFSTGHKGIHADSLETNSSETNGYEIKLLLVHCFTNTMDELLPDELGGNQNGSHKLLPCYNIHTQFFAVLMRHLQQSIFSL